MGYDVHITKKALWFDEGPDISPAEWTTYVASDPELRITGVAEIGPVEGYSGSRYVSPLLAEWSGHSSGGIVWFDFRNESIIAKNPDEETIEKLQRIAAKLGARVQGETGEFYDPIVPTPPPPPLLPAEVFDILVQTTGNIGSDMDFIRALVVRGMDSWAALRAFRLIQAAWGRALLRGVAITFSGEFVYFDAQGAVLERGQLEAEAWYRSAWDAAAEYLNRPHFRRIAEGSTEYQSVQEELAAMKEPQPLFGIPVYLFPLSISNEGLRKALQIIESETDVAERQLLQSQADRQKKSGPWWEFW